MTTLDDLQKAIARVEEYRAMPLMDQLKRNAGFSAAETNAWRTYAMLLEECASSYRRETTADVTEAMRLVREKLRESH